LGLGEVGGIRFLKRRTSGDAGMRSRLCFTGPEGPSWDTDRDALSSLVVDARESPEDAGEGN
jgi:hypothetical protein